MCLRVRVRFWLWGGCMGGRTVVWGRVRWATHPDSPKAAGRSCARASATTHWPPDHSMHSALACYRHTRMRCSRTHMPPGRPSSPVSAAAWAHPAATCTMFSGRDLTRCGAAAAARCRPNPSCPRRLVPQDHTVPWAVRAKEATPDPVAATTCGRAVVEARGGDGACIRACMRA